MTGDDSRHGGLRRTLGFWALASYGLGDILGAGIYAMMGRVAGVAGGRAWLAFAVSLFAATITALTYSELVTRFPRSGGESFYTQRGFRSPLVSTVVGFLVFCAGTLSLSAIAVAFSGYLSAWLPGVPAGVTTAAFIVALGAINFIGMRESSIANIVCTVIEASGLLIVVVVGLRYLAQQPTEMAMAAPPALEPTEWAPVLQGAALAFFAFIGFQDMVNVAEEVQRPARDFPRAILTALGVAGGLYVLIAVIATAVVPPDTLGTSREPLTEVVRVAGSGGLLKFFPIIALFAVANTGLLNFIMSSRLLYGMADQELLPAALARVHGGRRTPHLAILTVLGAALVLALSGSLDYLAGATSTLLLVVFLVVNLALVAIKWRASQPHRDGFRVPMVVPIVGAAVTAVVASFAEPTVLLTVLILGGIGAALHGARRLLR
jgi:amino acid transporter